METQQGKVLICDDSLLVRKKLKDILTSIGCEVFEARNGKEAVEVYQTSRPDLVFMDIVMPDTDGLEALKNLKAFDDQANVIMLSSLGTSDKLIQALKYGAADFIQKPYTVEQITQIVAKIAK
ncbi:response regulator [Sporomusaceae bacterium FL31]|nr:response regulator [Sporomusaceae bacterium FL31]GCE35578.1 response regulator [Sporomusaceae bacterium]